MADVKNAAREYQTARQVLFDSLGKAGHVPHVKSSPIGDQFKLEESDDLLTMTMSNSTSSQLLSSDYNISVQHLPSKTKPFAATWPRILHSEFLTTSKRSSSIVISGLATNEAEDDEEIVLDIFRHHLVVSVQIKSVARIHSSSEKVRGFWSLWDRTNKRIS